MTLLSVIKKSTAILCLTLSTNTVLAHTANDVACPSTDQIRQAAPLLNHAEEREHGYTVLTSGPAFSDDKRDWWVGTARIVAKSSNEAITIAQRYTAEVMYQESETASGLWCTYLTKSNNKVAAMYFNHGRAANTASHVIKNFTRG